MNKISLIDLFKVTMDAGKKILEVYAEEFEVFTKGDHSPLTQADKKAHASIMKGLEKIDPAIPILSEEGVEIPFNEREKWSRFWLVDPLDGTKEFIKKNGEFTVNIALVDGKYPRLGVIYAPALDVFYFGGIDYGSFKIEGASIAGITTEDELMEKSHRIPIIGNDRATRVVASRSHMTDETKAFIRELEVKHGNIEVVSSGSSLKFCLVAEGKADYYPRYAPTMEWDTAAGQAIVEGAGGIVVRYEDHERFDYNRENLLNGWFLVSMHNT
ncbi:3'(2'),5'-bisphosphate nucleotidase [Oceanobacillus limi]|uniref:3'(2'),5'-bisphosphate nucleotidase CysQ n=1 Tax=Oceanobacillus limi TaxID=930131 RepID=A0A1I0BN98_9BACI|nr:3'(2'),5'-bisphosphate nucleotidase CysQ [Oceanobacillus limi]SET07756.1 3'(2'),5'-bisphosphate nucleotidase [Oceanobacillus limi]